MSAPDLDGVTVAITGAAGGLGPTVCERLAGAGATLALTDLSEERLGEVAADLDLPADRIHTQVVDLLDPDATAGWARLLGGELDGVDALLHLVGGWRGGDPLATASLEDYEWLHDALVRTVQHTTRAFRDQLAESGRGRFVLISSSQAQRPGGTNAAYGAAKAAAEAWTLALADDLAHTGATANIIVVEAILTPRMRAENPGKEYPSFTPAEQIADAIAFVLSEGAEHMNGQRLSLHSA
jgi:NAD(P)-dependent dehydrogenase (short-subunit alcohol dehydrogenase family)